MHCHSLLRSSRVKEDHAQKGLFPTVLLTGASAPPQTAPQGHCCKKRWALVIPGEPGNARLDSAHGLFYDLFDEVCSVLRRYSTSS